MCLDPQFTAFKVMPSADTLPDALCFSNHDCRRGRGFNPPGQKYLINDTEAERKRAESSGVVERRQ
jgi:hypothetical protein